MIMIFNTAQRWHDKNHLTVTFVTYHSKGNISKKPCNEKLKKLHEEYKTRNY